MHSKLQNEVYTHKIYNRFLTVISPLFPYVRNCLQGIFERKILCLIFLGVGLTIGPVYLPFVGPFYVFATTFKNYYEDQKSTVIHPYDKKILLDASIFSLLSVSLHYPTDASTTIVLRSYSPWPLLV